jgi:predicted Na+-dependent transporter
MQPPTDQQQQQQQQQIIQLLFTILLPLVMGKSLRNFAKCRVFAKKYGVELKVFSSILLSMVPWMKISATADEFGNLPAEALVATIAIAIFVHLLYLVFNYSVTTFVLNLPMKERKAVTIVSSQKTLPVAISILEFLPTDVVGAVGLATIPIIAAHLTQIIIDGFVAAKWAGSPAVSETSDDEKDEGRGTTSTTGDKQGVVADDDEDDGTNGDIETQESETHDAQEVAGTASDRDITHIHSI